MDIYKNRALALLRIKYPEYQAFSMDELDVLAYFLWLNDITAGRMN